MADDVSEEDAVLQETFALFDRNLDGHIDAAELGTVFRALGHDPTPTQLKEIIAKVDKNKNGTIELEDLRELVNLKFNEKDPEKELTEAFHALDRDGNDYIEVSDLLQICTTLGEEPLTLEQAQEMIKFADIDGDGKIHISEFLNKFLDADRKIRNSLGHKKFKTAQKK